MRQATVVKGFLAIAVLAACSGPISTMRSPYHLRSVEVRNATDKPKVLKIEPTATQHLGAATTFTGVLRPGEVKSLYLYHGFEYDFRVLEEPGFEQLTHKTVQVDKDFGLVYAGDSLTPEVTLAASLGEPTTTFADSLQVLDPFGLRSGDRIQPDTTRGQDMPSSSARGDRAGTPGTAGQAPDRRHSLRAGSAGVRGRKSPRAVRAILRALEKAYPAAETALRYETPYQLLVATILSAQCTDERVNQITARLFRDHPGPEDLLRLPQEDLESYIRSCGLFRNKARNILAATRALVEEHHGEVPQRPRGFDGTSRRRAEDGQRGPRQRPCDPGHRGRHPRLPRFAKARAGAREYASPGRGRAHGSAPRGRVGRDPPPPHRARQGDLQGAHSPVRPVSSDALVRLVRGQRGLI